MGDLISGDDGLPAEVVGPWVKEKHEYLCRYVDISSGPRLKFVNAQRSKIKNIAGAMYTAGATYIDLFCGPGRARIGETGEYVDGGCVAAWKKSQKGNAPFSKVYIADKDINRRNAAYSRLKALGAPVIAIDGDALQAASALVQLLNPDALHFSFIDPFNLETLNFQIIEYLSRFKRMDMLIHYSRLDMQRNLDRYMANELSTFDTLAPGWREHIKTDQSPLSTRMAIFEYWKELVAKLNTKVSTDTKLITGSKNQPLYNLLLVTKHDLAKKFWKIASNPEGQTSLF